MWFNRDLDRRAEALTLRPMSFTGVAAIAGGLVLGLTLSGALPVSAQDTTSRGASVSGAVYDSVAKRPVPGALVQLVVRGSPHVSRATRTDAAGRFQIDSVTAGTWLMGFYHQALDSLGLASPLLQLDIRDSTPVRAMLAVPSPRTIVRATCGDSSGTSSLWMGQTRAAGTGAAVPRAKVVVQWSTLVVQENRVNRQTPTISLDASDEGRFAICGVPTGELLFARASQAEDSSGVVTLTIPEEGLLQRDLLLPADSLSRNTRIVVASADSLPPVRRGGGRIRGIVRKTDGAPLANVRLTFWETGDEVTTGASGNYEIDSLPPGSATLEARALGYLPLTRTVDIHPSASAVADFVMESRKTYLDTVRVVGTRVYESPQFRAFLERKKRGFGYFMDEDQIERRNPFYVSDLFRMVPGVRILPGGFGGQVLMRGTGFQAWCTPTVFLDGMRMASIDGIGFESFVSPHDVRAVEVYTRGSSMPGEFSTFDGCGAIVIWTGGRRAKIGQ